jgi:hypothetical protein
MLRPAGDNGVPWAKPTQKRCSIPFSTYAANSLSAYAATGVDGWLRGMRYPTALAAPPFLPEDVFPPVHRGPEYSGITLQCMQSIVIMIRLCGMLHGNTT